MNKFHEIPAELRALDQWVLWKYIDVGAKKLSKVPYSCEGYKASVIEAKTWNTYLNVLNAFSLGNYDGIGFVFQESNNLTFIDLDECEGNKVDFDRQLKVFKEFDSYSEISPSGKGLHIIVRGKVPTGRRRAHIEVYSTERYATMTGNVHLNKPIADRQDMLTQLYEQMGGSPQTTSYKGDTPEIENDTEIITRGSAATNGDKFSRLLKGEWQADYSSQSEADFAFIDIVSFYTQNRTQIARIFRNSALGNRDKARRKDYVEGMINQSFDRMLPLVDIDGFRIELENKLNERQISNNDTADGVSDSASASVDNAQLALPLANSPSTTTLPPGLVGEIAQFVFQSSPRPVEEIALAAAIGLMAGICGRAYNISGMGLNQYVMLIAPTGTGKEAMATGIEKLINQVSLSVPTATEFIGPSEIASGQALAKYLAKSSQCFVSILGEIGLRIQQISSYQATSAEISLRRMLLDFYNKSGHSQVMRPSIFADAEKNTLAISSPAFSILGESTPERFYGALNEEMINEGLLPRFMIIEYMGKRVSANDNHNAIMPSMMLIDKLSQLCAHAKTLMSGRKVINIQAEPNADKLLRDFDKYCDNRVNETEKELIRHLWSRAHVKVLRVAGLLAVGVNYYEPIVGTDHVLWAMNMVQHDIRALSAKFEAGLIGVSSSESKQLAELKKILKDYVTSDYDKIKSYAQMPTLHANKIIPYQYVSRRLIAVAAFRNDKIGSTNAIKRSLQVLIDADYIREVGKNEMTTKFSTTQKAFMISNMSVLE